MRILFATSGGYLPQMTGGVQSSVHQLARRMQDAGHEVAVMSALHAGGWTEWRSRIQRRLTRKRFSRDAGLGYPVFRAWVPTDGTEVVKKFRPDVAVIQQGHHTHAMAKNMAEAGMPTAIYFRNVEMEELDGDISDLAGAIFIANSAFTARKYYEAFGVTSTVIPPLVDPGTYRTESTGQSVTFINPNTVKGLDVALAVAGLCPDIPFTFVESWPMLEKERAVLLLQLGKHANISFKARTNDMKSVYGRTKILLAPSQWEEAWGRVASEAHCSGIPVLGSNRGGLPEAIGPGGIILPYDAPANEWAAALRRMWDDPQEYARLSEAARLYAKRPEMDSESQFRTFLSVVERAAKMN